MRGAGGYEAGPSFAPELLTDLLVSGPCASARSRGVNGEASQLLDVREVGKLEVEPPAMMVVGDVVLGGEPPLGKRAIPLRCGCCHGVGEVEGTYNIASLPAPIRWGVCASE
jgi:hypothetical protein